MRTKLILLIAGITLSSIQVAHSEKIKLSNLKKADYTALQRGQSVANGACALAIIKEIDAYGGKQAMREFRIDVEADPIVIQGNGIKHICNDGKHTMIENGKSMLLQKYDDEGNPTMMEQ